MQDKKLLQQLSEHQLVMSKFVHEIRNPLTLMSCKLQLLTSAHPEAEHWKEIEDIQEHLIYVRDLINELSDYNNAGRLSLQPASMYNFLYNIAESFRPMFDYLGINFVTDLPMDLPEISADTLRLRQALTNLLRNAQEAISHDHGKIILSACMVPNIHSKASLSNSEQSNFLPSDTSAFWLRISVCDNGCGIPTEHMTQLGTPFVTHKENGTGLGLSITRQIIEAHGGTLEIESTPDEGTTVHLYLPSPRMV